MPLSIADSQRTLTAARQTLDRLRQELLALREPGGYWCGELAASALSTATAISALAAVVRSGSGPSSELRTLIRRGLAYLATQQNPDGGYGDTDRSHSNIATSYLVLAARTLAANLPPESPDHADSADLSSRPADLDSLRDYITRAGGLQGLRERYGTDKTFVVPIMTNLAIAGLVPWADVPRLPFEAAVFPGSMYRFLQMPVVSYAIPALVAIGQVHHFLGPRPLWPIHAVRAAAVAPTMRVLQRMQPDSGGYLEATPLTAFVLMSLAASGRGEHPVARRCVDFLVASVREDGSWPIDTNLATWVTSLAVHALSQDPQDDGTWATPELITWHLSCQHQQRHPFTGADPGGWGWSDLSGAVPDGDDTPAAILAVAEYQQHNTSPPLTRAGQIATIDGLRWLLGLQNRDGGLPTFCRGWGKLPFDRSSTDLTAHLLRAIDAAGTTLAGADAAIRQQLAELSPQLSRARQRALAFLRRQQRADGRWVPLWFGNQDHREEENPIYGTGRVLLAVAGELSLAEPTARAVDFLLSQQNADGGWGGGPSRRQWLLSRGDQLAETADKGAVASSLEETAVAVEALVAVLRAELQPGGAMGGKAPLAAENGPSPRVARCTEAIIRGVDYLAQAIESAEHHEPWPIGFYFAKLWYHERLYPVVLPMAALGAALELLSASAPRE